MKARTPTALLRERFPHLRPALALADAPRELSTGRGAGACSCRAQLEALLGARGLAAAQYKVAKLGSGQLTKYMAAVTVEGEQYKTYPRTFPSQAEAEEALAGLVLSRLGVQVEEVAPAPMHFTSPPPVARRSAPPPVARPPAMAARPPTAPVVSRPPAPQAATRPPAPQAASRPPKSSAPAGPRGGVPPSPPRSVCSTTSQARRLKAEELFQASLNADNDSWLQFQIAGGVAARAQAAQLDKWLAANPPSRVARSAGIGWIAVKFRDKGRKVVEAKAAWEAWSGERNMRAVNQLAEQFGVRGGKWMCHLPAAAIDEVWGKVARTLLAGGLGAPVYMVKVSPVEDVTPGQAGGEHVLIVYNTDYTDTEQVMRVENLLRSAGVSTPVNYKPDIFSALGIYRNNRWGFRPTIYTSSCVEAGRSRVETVGTGDWFYNSALGLERPAASARGLERSTSSSKVTERPSAPAKAQQRQATPAEGPGRPSPAARAAVRAAPPSSGPSCPSATPRIEERPGMAAKAQERPTLAAKAGPATASASKGLECPVAKSKRLGPPSVPRTTVKSSTNAKALEVEERVAKEGGMGREVEEEKFACSKTSMGEREDVTSSYRQVLDTIQPMAMMMSNKVKSGSTSTEVKAKLGPFNKAQEKGNKSEVVKKETKKTNVNNVNNKLNDKTKVAVKNECPKSNSHMSEKNSVASKKTEESKTKENVEVKEEEVGKKAVTKKGLPAWMEKMERQLGMISIDQLANI